MERMNETNELEEMRAQMALLKEKLDKEEILTDNLLKQAMTGKMSTINRYKWITLFAALFALTFGNLSWYGIGLPLRFLIGTSILMVVSVVATWIIHAKMDEEDIMNGNLLEVAKNAKKLKMQYITWQRIGWPVIVVWLAWFAYELLSLNHDKEYLVGLLIGCAIGGIIGGIWGHMMNRKVLKTCDDLIKQIEE
ncbi:MAG: hypothetical protein J5770_05525 [Bacteroidaceae bacterium]|nr:hypothetical protein [Bacteroidaceae bacterium]